jgi:hypothetical protein
MGEIHEKTCKIVDILYESFKDKYNPFVRTKMKLGIEGLKKEIRDMEVEELIKLLSKINKEINEILYCGD